MFTTEITITVNNIIHLITCDGFPLECRIVGYDVYVVIIRRTPIIISLSTTYFTHTLREEKIPTPLIH